MTVELEDLGAFQVETEARLARLETVSDEHAEKINGQTGAFASMDADITAIQVVFRKQHGLLQALHLTQNEHTAALRELRTGQAELRGVQNEHTAALRELRAGIKTIVGLLESVNGTDS